MPVVNDLENIPVLERKLVGATIVPSKTSYGRTFVLSADGALYFLGRRGRNPYLDLLGTSITVTDRRTVAKLLNIPYEEIEKAYNEAYAQRQADADERELDQLRRDARSLGYELVEADSKTGPKEK